MASKVLKRGPQAPKNKFALAVDMMESTIDRSIAFPRVPQLKFCPDPVVKVIKHYEPNVMTVNSSVCELPCNVECDPRLQYFNGLQTNQNAPKLKSQSHPTRKNSETKKKTAVKKSKVQTSCESVKSSKRSNAAIPRKSKSNKLKCSEAPLNQNKNTFQEENHLNFLSNKLAVLDNQIQRELIKIKETSGYVQKLKDEIVDIPQTLFGTTIVAADLKAEISEYLISRLESETSPCRESLCKPLHVTSNECPSECLREPNLQDDCCFALPDLGKIDTCDCVSSDLSFTNYIECQPNICCSVVSKSVNSPGCKNSDTNFFKNTEPVCTTTKCCSAFENVGSTSNINCSCNSTSTEKCIGDSKVVSYEISQVCYNNYDGFNICMNTQNLLNKAAHEIYIPCQNLEPTAPSKKLQECSSNNINTKENTIITQSIAVMVPSKNKLNVCGELNYFVESEIIKFKNKDSGKTLKTDKENIPSYFNVCCNGEIFRFKYPSNQDDSDDQTSQAQTVIVLVPEDNEIIQIQDNLVTVDTLQKPVVKSEDPKDKGPSEATAKKKSTPKPVPKPSKPQPRAKAPQQGSTASSSPRKSKTPQQAKGGPKHQEKSKEQNAASTKPPKDEKKTQENNVKGQQEIKNGEQNEQPTKTENKDIKRDTSGQESKAIPEENSRQESSKAETSPKSKEISKLESKNSKLQETKGSEEKTVGSGKIDDGKDKSQETSKKDSNKIKTQETKHAEDKTSKVDDDSKSKEYIKIIQEKDAQIQKLKEQLSQAQKQSEQNKETVTVVSKHNTNPSASSTKKSGVTTNELVLNDTVLKTNDKLSVPQKSHISDTSLIQCNCGKGENSAREVVSLSNNKAPVCFESEKCLNSVDLSKKPSGKHLLTVQLMPSINIRPPLTTQCLPSVVIQDCECIPENMKNDNVACVLSKCELEEIVSPCIGTQACVSPAQEHVETQINREYMVDIGIQVLFNEDEIDLHHINENLSFTVCSSLSNKRSTVSQWALSNRAVQEHVQQLMKDPDTELIYRSYQLLNESSPHADNEAEIDQSALSHIDINVYKTFVNPDGFKGGNDLISQTSSKSGFPANFYTNKATQCNSNESLSNQYSTCVSKKQKSIHYSKIKKGFPEPDDFSCLVVDKQVGVHSDMYSKTEQCTNTNIIEGMCSECGLQKLPKESAVCGTSTTSDPDSLFQDLLKIVESASSEYVITHDVSLQLSNSGNSLRQNDKKESTFEFYDYSALPINDIPFLNPEFDKILHSSENTEFSGKYSKDDGSTTNNSSNHSFKPVTIMPVSVPVPASQKRPNLSGGDCNFPSDLIAQVGSKIKPTFCYNELPSSTNVMIEAEVDLTELHSITKTNSNVSEGELNESDGEIQCQNSIDSIGEISKSTSNSLNQSSQHLYK